MKKVHPSECTFSVNLYIVPNKNEKGTTKVPWCVSRFEDIHS